MLFIPVAPIYYDFLYELLKEKTPEQNISHVEMPEWEEHVEFNNKVPYKRDFVVEEGVNLIGRIYLSRNDEIGIAIKKEFQGKGYGTKILKKFLKQYKGPFLANISPRNKTSQKLFEKLGFKLIQYTYKYDSDNSC